MEALNPPRKLIEWTRACVESPSFACVINGSPSYFHNRRGIRQGDPLSPYLIVIVANILSFMLRDMVNRKLISLFHFKNQFSISHLFMRMTCLCVLGLNRSPVGMSLNISKFFMRLPGWRLMCSNIPFISLNTTCTLPNDKCFSFSISEKGNSLLNTLEPTLRLRLPLGLPLGMLLLTFNLILEAKNPNCYLKLGGSPYSILLFYPL